MASRRIRKGVAHPRKKTYAALKKELDRVFSIWVRQRGMDENGINSCISCGVSISWTKLQCGHFFGRSKLATRWHELNCWPQCVRCNILLNGNYPAYSAELARRFGGSLLIAMQELSNKPTKLNRSDLEALIERYSIGHLPEAKIAPG